MKTMYENNNNLFVRALLDRGEDYLEYLDKSSIYREGFKIIKDVLTNKLDLEKHALTFLNPTVLNLLEGNIKERYMEKYNLYISMQFCLNNFTPFSCDPHYQAIVNKVTRQVQMYEMIINQLNDIRIMNNISGFRTLQLNLNSLGLMDLLKNEPIYN